MENLLFLIWMLGYPLVSSVSGLIAAKESVLHGRKTPSDAAFGFDALVQVVLYAAVAILLYQ